MTPPWRYLIALGSNIAHPRHGPPPQVLRAALAVLGQHDLELIRRSRIIATVPLGPSRRRYANGAAIIETALSPRALLDRLQAIESAFGRNRRCQRWSARTLDLDIILWTGGTWQDRRLTIPHPQYAARAFVLRPANQIAANWRDPCNGLYVKHSHARLTRRTAMPKGRKSQTQSVGPIAQSVEQLTFNQ